MSIALDRRLPAPGTWHRLFPVFLAATAAGLVRTVDQPSVNLHVGGTGVAVAPSDVLYVVVAVALVAPARTRFLRVVARNRALVALVAGFAIWLVATAARNGFTPTVTAVKLAEPVVLGLAALLVLDSESGLNRLAGLILGVTIVADVVGSYDFVRNGGGRADAFLGTHDFSALATLPLLVVLAGLFVPARWSVRTRWVAFAAAFLGLALTAALASLVGLYLGTAVLLALAARRRRLALRPVALTLAILVTVTATTLALRRNDLGFLYQWAGKTETHHAQFASSWSQRLIYAYVGGRIFLDRPIIGTGWWGEVPPSYFARYVPDARRRFPDNPPRYFPPVDRPFIPQQAYDEVLYELGVVGVVLFLSGLAWAAIVATGRAARAAAPTVLDFVPILWLAAMAGELAGEGLFGGIPLTTLYWLTLGVAAYSGNRSPA